MNVEERVIADAGHWLMEEQPASTVKAIWDFLDARPETAARGWLTSMAFSLDQTQAMQTLGAVLRGLDRRRGNALMR